MIKQGFEKRHEGLQWKSSSTVEKFSPDQVVYATALLGHEPTGTELLALVGEPEDGVLVDPESNLLTTAGLGRITSLIIGGGGQAATATAARIGVGNSSTAASAGQTDLQASSGSGNRQFNVMEATYPQQSAGVLTFKASYASGEANHAWAEWCIDVGTPTVAAGTTVAALMLNRKVADNGTKASGAVWAFTVTITLS